MATPTAIKVPKFDITKLAVKEKVSKFTFTVPDTHAEAGKKIEKPFSFYEVAEGDNATAQAIIDGKGWNLPDMVNEFLKKNARATHIRQLPSLISLAKFPRKLCRSA